MRNLALWKNRRIDQRAALVAATFLAVLALAALLAPWLAPYSPTEQTDPVAARLVAPGASFHAIRLAHGWRLASEVERTPAGLRYVRLGVESTLPADAVRNLTQDGVADRRFFFWGADEFGRDIFSRWLHGARLSLAIGLLAVALSSSLGIAIGALAALGGRWLDAVLMRAVDALLAFPWTLLLIALAALFPLGPIGLGVILGASGWMAVSRLARAEIRSLRDRDFVHAARGLGLGETRIFFRHVLPNAWTPLLVYATLNMGYVILTESALSFLGLGIRPPDPSWGNMIDAGRFELGRAWWLFAFPAAGLVLTVLSLHVLSDGLRDLLDPRSGDVG